MSPYRPFSLCVFLGSSDEAPKAHVTLTQDLAHELVKAKVRLVYGGQFDGLMGVLANEMLLKGGDILGIVPKTLWHPKADCINCVQTISLSERKDLMVQESDGFIVLPGGIGTMDEVMHILTLKYIKMLDKPLVFVDPDGYWASFYTMLNDMLNLKYTAAENLKLYTVVKTPQEAIALLI